MRDIIGIHKCDLNVNEYTKISGIVEGNVIVSSDQTLEISGMLNGDVFLGPYAKVYIRGRVDGVIENLGGHLEIWGTVSKYIIDPKGETVIHSGANVNNKQYHNDYFKPFPGREK